MSDTIPFKEMLIEMESTNATFEVEWTTLDKARRTGGELKRHPALVLKRQPIRRGLRSKVETALRRKRMPLSQSFNLYDPEYKKYYSIHKQLITRFNGLEVL